MRNRFNLKELVEQSGKRKRNVALAPIEPATDLERQLARIALPIIAEWAEIIENLLPIYEAGLAQMTRDAAGDDMGSYLEAVSQKATRLAVSIDHQLNQWTVRVEEWHRKRFAGQVKAAVGVDIFPFLSSADVDNQLGAFADRNSSLIKGLNDEMRKRVNDTVWREFVNQTPRRAIGKQLAEQLSIGRARANFIARDQTLKLSGQLDQTRQEEAGIEKYKWRTAEDERVRPTHAIRNGKVYRWDEPGLKPREEPNCRCTAQAWIELMEEEGPPPNPNVQPAGVQAEVAATRAEEAFGQADIARAAQLSTAEFAERAAMKALALAQRQAERLIARAARQEAMQLAEVLSVRAQQIAAKEAAQAAAAQGKKELTTAKNATTKAQNAVAKLKAMEAGGSAEISAVAQNAQWQIAQNPEKAYTILGAAQKKVTQFLKETDAAKTKWLETYIAELEKLKKAVGSSSKSSLAGELKTLNETLAEAKGQLVAKPGVASSPVPVGAHGGHFSTAIGMEGKFVSTYGFSSQALAESATLLSGPPHVLQNFLKVNKAFETWKKTGKLPSPGDIAPVPPPPPPGLRDPALGKVIAGETKAMRKPKTTAEWKPAGLNTAQMIQDTEDRAISATSGAATSQAHLNVWESYKASGYRSWNEGLRGGRLRTAEKTKRMDELTRSYELPEDMLLHRGTGYFKGVETIEDALKATELRDSGYFSTTFQISTAEGFGGAASKAGAPRVHFTIRAKKGQRVAAGTRGEGEFIFPRDTRWRVLDVEVSPGRYGGQVAHMLVEPW